MKIRGKKQGFTLLELLVVVIIIGILTTIAVPQFIGFADRSRESEAQNVISTLLTAELLVQQETGAFIGGAGALAALAVQLPAGPPPGGGAAVAGGGLKYWNVPVITVPGAITPAGNPVAAANVMVNLTSKPNHGHGAGNDANHEVRGWIDGTGVKAIAVDRAENPNVADNFVLIQ